MASINVNQGTTLQDIQKFADSVGDGAKIRAKANQDGSFTLYASTKKNFGIKDFLFNHGAHRREDARAALTTVLSRGVQGQGDATKTAMSNVLAGLPGQGNLSKADLTTLLQGARAAHTQALQAAPQLNTMGAALKEAVTQGNADAVKTLALQLGDHLAQGMRNQSGDRQLDFAISHGDLRKDQIVRQFAGQLADAGPLAGGYANADPAVKAFADQAYHHAALNLSDHRIDDNQIVLNGTTYTKEGTLGEGGFGTIEIYKDANDNRIALKSATLDPSEDPPQTEADKFDEQAREARAHRQAAAGNPTNVIGLLGAVRTPGGGLQIALELAPRGNAFEVMEKLTNELAAGNISQQDANTAKLTLLRDMALGLQHVQQNQGMTHLDLKSLNYFVDANGVAKLGDFGTAGATDAQGNRQLTERLVDNPRWKAPEMIKGFNEYSERVDGIRQLQKNAMQGAAARLDRNLSPQDRQVAIQSIIKTYNERAAQVAQDNPYSVTGRADTWSLGVDLYHAFAGAYPFQSQFASHVERDITTFASNHNNRMQIPNTVNTGLGQNDLGHLNALIGQMMHPDPSQRPSLTQVLQSPLFQGLDDNRGHAVIRQVTQ